MRASRRRGCAHSSARRSRSLVDRRNHVAVIVSPYQGNRECDQGGENEPLERRVTSHFHLRLQGDQLDPGCPWEGVYCSAYRQAASFFLASGLSPLVSAGCAGPQGRHPNRSPNDWPPRGARSCETSNERADRAVVGKSVGAMSPNPIGQSSAVGPCDWK